MSSYMVHIVAKPSYCSPYCGNSTPFKHTLYLPDEYSSLPRFDHICKAVLCIAGCFACCATGKPGKRSEYCKNTSLFELIHRRPCWHKFSNSEQNSSYYLLFPISVTSVHEQKRHRKCEDNLADYNFCAAIR